MDDKYGASILQIVRNNPKKVTIDFGGKKGEAVCKNYQKLTKQVKVQQGKNLNLELDF